jgi:mycothiol synthase
VHWVRTLDDWTFRPLTESDAQAVLDILLAAEAAEPSESFVDLTEVEHDLREPGINLPEGSLGAMVGDRLVAFGLLLTPGHAAEYSVYLSGAVLPEFRGAGIGQTLLARLAAQAKTFRDVAHPELPGLLKIWIQSGRESTVRFASAAGFTVRRYFFEMRADLDRPFDDAGTPPAGIEIRTWSPADDEGVRLAYNASFADHWGSVPASPDRWRALFADSPFFRPESSRIALIGGDVVGFVLVDEFDSETQAKGYRTGYVDRVGTLRDVRGRGVARALLAQSMAALASSGCRYAELGVDADSPTGAGRLYERLGYQVLRRNQVFGLDF